MSYEVIPIVNYSPQLAPLGPIAIIDKTIQIEFASENEFSENTLSAYAAQIAYRILWNKYKLPFVFSADALNLLAKTINAVLAFIQIECKDWVNLSGDDWIKVLNGCNIPTGDLVYPTLNGTERYHFTRNDLEIFVRELISFFDDRLIFGFQRGDTTRIVMKFYLLTVYFASYPQVRIDGLTGIDFAKRMIVQFNATLP